MGEFAEPGAVDPPQRTLEGLVESGDRQVELEGVDQSGSRIEQPHLEGREILGHPAQLDGDGKPVGGVQLPEGRRLHEVGLGAMDARKVAKRILGDDAAIPVIIQP